jgi:hypothetical protein
MDYKNRKKYRSETPEKKSLLKNRGGFKIVQSRRQESLESSKVNGKII